MCAHFCKWIRANWIFLRVRLVLFHYEIFTLCCLLFISIYLLFDLLSLFQQSFLNCDINFLWYQIPFSSFLLNNTCRKIKRKLPFSLRCNLNFFLNFNTFFIYVFFFYIQHIFLLSVIFTYLIFLFRNLFFGTKYKNVVIFIMPFENKFMPYILCHLLLLHHLSDAPAILHIFMPLLLKYDWIIYDKKLFECKILWELSKYHW